MSAPTSVAAERTPLAVGRVTGLLDGADLRYVAVDGVEVVRRIYVTVRDLNWDVPPLTALDVTVDPAPDAIEVTAAAEQRSGTAAVRWRASAVLRADGRVRYAVTVEPLESFPFNRIGLCLLHPPETAAGRPFAAEGDGARTDGRLPEAIAPQLIEDGEILPLFPAFRTLAIDVDGLGRCAFAFEGEAFEMEDQRNWSDGSFKTYCTPLSRPRPRPAVPGEAIEQAIEMTPPRAAVAPPPRRAGAAVELRVGTPLPQTVPAVGLGLGEPLEGAAAAAIRALGLEHLRADLRHPDRFARVLAQADADAAAVGAPLVLALHLGEDVEEELAALAGPLGALAAPVLRVLAFSRGEPASQGPLVRAARERLAPLLPNAVFAGGTDVWFVDLNRGRPDPAAMDAVAWSITPQVHGDDELTMVEAIDAQTDQVRTAHAFAGGRDLLPGPVTLRPRYNPNAVDAAAQALDHPPASIDPRQGSAFAGAWTAASLHALALGGVTAVTYYETAGPRGVLAAGGGELWPCGAALAAASRWRGRRVVAASSSAPLRARALLVEDGEGGMDGVLVNLDDERCTVRITGLPAFEDAELEPWEVRPIA